MFQFYTAFDRFRAVDHLFSNAARKKYRNNQNYFKLEKDGHVVSDHIVVANHGTKNFYHENYFIPLDKIPDLL